MSRQRLTQREMLMLLPKTRQLLTVEQLRTLLQRRTPMTRVVHRNRWQAREAQGKAHGSLELVVETMDLD